MPYPNFHVVHLAPFSEFDPETVRTEYGGTVFGVTMPKNVWVRYGVHKTRKEELPIAIGFPVEVYSISEVEEIMKNNNIPYMDINPAQQESALRKMELRYYIKGKGRMLERANSATPRKLTFSGIARTSNPILGYDGVLEYDDTDTYTIESLPIPIDFNHYETIGKIMVVKKTKGNLYIKGEIISKKENDTADDVIRALLSGLPYQLSIFATPNADSVVEESSEDRGDGTIIRTRTYRNYTLRGVAVCYYGADGATKIIPREEDEMPTNDPQEIPQPEVPREAAMSGGEQDVRVLSADSAQPPAESKKAEEEIEKGEETDFRKLSSVIEDLQSLAAQLREELASLKEERSKPRPQERENKAQFPSFLPEDAAPKAVSRAMLSVQSFARSIKNS